MKNKEYRNKGVINRILSELKESGALSFTDIRDYLKAKYNITISEALLKKRLRRLGQH
jgi:DNA-binding HxlR family transcriptional regulator